MSRLEAKLPECLLLDGGLGTSLVARGLVLGSEPPETWNITKPEVVADIHGSFFAAGAGAVQTNTFGANRLRLRAQGRENAVAECNLYGAQLARQVAPEDALVIGSLGPTGALPPPEGDADLFELEDVFAEQAMLLAEGGVDFFHIESLYHPKEARAAIRGCRYGAPDVPVVASLRCQKRGDRFLTDIGFTAEHLIRVFAEERTDGLGVNCSMAPEEMVDLVTAMAKTVKAPVFAQPTIAPLNLAPLYPDEFATGVGSLFAAGARAVGGCCGTGAADIRAAASALPSGDTMPIRDRHA